MQKDELLRYIKKDLDQGATKEKIVAYLTVGGWDKNDIEKAFQEIQKNSNAGAYNFDLDPNKARRERIAKYISKFFFIIFIIIIIFLIIAYIVGGEV